MITMAGRQAREVAPAPSGRGLRPRFFPGNGLLASCSGLVPAVRASRPAGRGPS